MSFSLDSGSKLSDRDLITAADIIAKREEVGAKISEAEIEENVTNPHTIENLEQPKSLSKITPKTSLRGTTSRDRKGAKVSISVPKHVESDESEDEMLSGHIETTEMEEHQAQEVETAVLEVVAEEKEEEQKEEEKEDTFGSLAPEAPPELEEETEETLGRVEEDIEPSFDLDTSDVLSAEEPKEDLFAEEEFKEDEKVVEDSESVIQSLVSESLSAMQKLLPQSPVSISSLEEPSSLPSLTGSHTFSAQLSRDFARTRTSSGSKFSLVTYDSQESQRSFGMTSYTEEDSGQLSIISEEPDADIAIDRKMYYDLHAVMTQRLQVEQEKNAVLHAKLARSYMRRKMFYVFKAETVFLDEAIAKYQKDLDSLELLHERSEREKNMLQDEVLTLTNKRDVQKVDLEARFKQLQEAEMEYVKGLTLTPTNRMNVDRLERVIKRQDVQLKELVKLRLGHIKLRNNVYERTKQLEGLDNLGPGFRIMDYVHLKQDNRLLQDRLEEKESEIIRIRKGCRSSMQVLAHEREKVAQLDSNIEKFKDVFEAVNQEYFDAREEIAFLRRERYLTRRRTKKLKFDNGLLAYPKLLADMAHAETELGILKQSIHRLQADCADRTDKIRAVRKNMELYIRRKKKREQSEREQSSSFLSVVSSSSSSQAHTKPPEQPRTSVNVIKAVSFRHASSEVFRPRPGDEASIDSNI